MIRIFIINIIRFFLLVLFQVLFLKNFSLYNLAIPWFYILFILLLPLQTSNFLLFLLSFLLGLSVDMFFNSPGLNAAACTAMAFCRILLIRIITPRDGYESTVEPGIRSMGLRWFLMYSSVLILVHHLVLFNLEIFRSQEFLLSSIKAISSAVFTLFLVILSQYIFSKRRT
ncbi:MAG TPA: rod shape-determining protein MreD [Anseongella sp.]